MLSNGMAAWTGGPSARCQARPQSRQPSQIMHASQPHLLLMQIWMGQSIRSPLQCSAILLQS